MAAQYPTVRIGDRLAIHGDMCTIVDVSRTKIPYYGRYIRRHKHHMTGLTDTGEKREILVATLELGAYIDANRESARASQYTN